MLHTSKSKTVKRLSDKTSLLIIVSVIASVILITWALGADYSDALSRISY